jgi:hypothetical protein
MRPADAGANRPFRWDLVTPDQLGTLLDGLEPPRPPFANEVIDAAAKVLARSGGGELYFVGRSLDSMFDLLSGALAGTEHAPRLHRLPFSSRFEITDVEAQAIRDILRASGIMPQSLARAHRPTALADLVSEGGTFGNLFRVLRDWVTVEREPWPVIRRKLRFVGVTRQERTSPNTWRWQQAADWPAELPRSSVTNVSLHPSVWSYFGNRQTKLTRSYHPRLWTADEPDGPQHDEKTREALAEAVAYVELGRHADTRSRLARTMASEPAYAESWLRTLVRQMA